MDFARFLCFLATGLVLLVIYGVIKSALDSFFTATYYSIVVESADVLSAGHKGHIHVKLIGDDGEVGREEQLVVSSFPEDFKRGHKHSFKVKKQTKQYNKITGIFVRGGKYVGETGWRIDKLTVTDEETGAEAVIPVFTNIRSGGSYKFLVDDDALPQSVSSSMRERKDDLREMRELYEFTEERMPGCPPLAKQLPPEESFSYNYQFRIAEKAIALKIDAEFETLFHGEFRTIEDIHKVFHRMFNVFPEPSNFNRWRDDVLFGMQRLMGVNPNVIRLCTEIPDKLAVNNQMLKPFLENMTLSQAIKEKKNFHY